MRADCVPFWNNMQVSRPQLQAKQVSKTIVDPFSFAVIMSVYRPALSEQCSKALSLPTWPLAFGSDRPKEHLALCY